MTDLMCIALAVYMEARGESLVGQISVAKVVQNRMARESATACEVISRRNQFPWFDNLTKTDKNKIKKSKNYAKSLDIAKRVTYKTIDDPTKGATYFFGRKEHPSCAKKCKLTLVEGGHKFYKER